MSKQSFDDFDEFAKEYRRIHNKAIQFSGTDSDFFSEQKVEEIRRRETGQVQRVLDIGCGDGNSAIFFRNHFSECAYVGLDASKVSVAVAKDRALSRADFVNYDGFDMPFLDESFDVALIACVLHHIDSREHESILGEAQRVLRPGGRLYIFEHNPWNPVTQRVVKTCPFDKDAVLMTASYLKKLLVRLKFQSVSVAFTIFFPRHRLFSAMFPIEPYLEWLPLGGQYVVRSIKNGSND